MVGWVWNLGASQIIKPDGRGRLPRDSHCYGDGGGFVDGRTSVEEESTIDFRLEGLEAKEGRRDWRWQWRWRKLNRFVGLSRGSKM